MPTGIEWAHEVWNVTAGCTPAKLPDGTAHPGCDNCWSRTLHTQRHEGTYRKGTRAPQYAEPFNHVQCLPNRLDVPFHWRKPRCPVFVNSGSDLFHEDVPDDFIERVYHTMRWADRHTYVILTKRAQRMRKFRSRFPNGVCREVLDNLALGVSVSNQASADALLPILRRVPARWHIVSYEPAVEPVDFGPYIEHLDWIICGGESGPKARPMHPQWARCIRDMCVSAGVPFFFKQWGEWLSHHDWRDDLKDDNDVETRFDTMAFYNDQWEEASTSGLDNNDSYPFDTEFMGRVGKKLAGKMLDGRVWDQTPWEK